MDASIREILTNGGIDVDGMLQRCMGSEALVVRLLKKFPADATYARLVEAFAKNDADGALEASHTLKGVCGNLSISELFALLDKQVATLRHNDMAGAAAMMPDVALKYDAAVQAIQKALA